MNSPNPMCGRPSTGVGQGHSCGILFYLIKTNSGTVDTNMLDVIVCSATLHKCIHNCHMTLDGLNSNHRVVTMVLNLTSIKYKVKPSIKCGDFDWRKICEEDNQWKLYN
jgi:hypothetical protein